MPESFEELKKKEKEKIFRIVSQIWKIKPDKRKKWISQQHHDRVLYGQSEASRLKPQA